MMNNPLTPVEIRLRTDLGSDGDTGVEAHAKLDRLSTDLGAAQASIDDIQTDSTAILAELANATYGLSALKTSQTAIKGDTVSIIASLANGTYGLSAIETIAAAILADTADMQPKLGLTVTGTLTGDIAAVKAQTAAIEVDTQDIQASLASGTSGLAAIKTAVDGVDTKATNIFNRIGAPSGASVSADILAVKTETALIKTDTTDILGKIGTTTLGTLTADLADITSKINSVQNNTRTTVAILEQFEIPPAGQTVYYLIQLNNYDAIGNMEEPDSAPVVDVVTFEGADRSANLMNDAHGQTSVMLKDSDGQYHIRYKVTDAATPNEGLLFTFNVTEATVTRKIDRVARIVEEISSTFTAADRLTLASVLSDTADMQPKLGTPSVGGVTISGDIAAVKAQAVAIEGKVDIVDTNVDTVLAEIAKIESKNGSNTFDRATDSLEAISDYLAANLTAAKQAAFVWAKKTSGVISFPGNIPNDPTTEVVNLAEVNGVSHDTFNIKQINVVPQTACTDFDVEVYENSGATILLAKFTKANSSKGDLQLASDLVYINQDSTPGKNVYVKISNKSNAAATFNVEVRGVALQRA